MKNILLFLFITYSTVSFGQIINFPDSDLNYIVLNTLTVDSDDDNIPDQFLDLNGDGLIQVSEVANVQSLFILDTTVSSFNYSPINLSGIEQFPLLEKLNIRSRDLINPDLSQFPSLLSLKLTDASSITNLALNSNTLESLDFENQGLNTINFSGVTSLKELRIQENGSNLLVMDLTNLSQLEKLEVSSRNVTSLNLSGNTILKEVSFTQFPLATMIDFSNNLLLEEITIDSDMYSNGMFNGLNLLNEINLESCYPANTMITSMDFSNNQQLERLKIYSMPNLTSLNLVSNLLLKKLEVSRTTITSLDFTPNQQLSFIDIDSGIQGLSQLNTLNITNNIALRELYITAENLTSLSLLNNINLEVLKLGNVGQNLSLNLSSLTNLSELSLSQQFGFTSLDLSANTNLESLSLGTFTPALPNLDLSNNPLLNDLGIVGNNGITELSLQSNPLLGDVFIRFSDLQNVNLNTEVPLKNLLIYDNDFLEYFTFKNNIVDVREGFNIFFARNNMLNYICVDEIDIDTYRNVSNSAFHNYPSLEINSYCSFNPGGSFNEIHGNISIDINYNGCDVTDPVFSNFNFIATDGTTTGTISSNQSGTYYAPVADGQHTITPNPENPTYWNFSPPNLVVDFPTQTSPFTQDFCVTANGMIEDLEIIVVPLEQARPGFDTDYKVVVKNKGNQTSSGSVTLDFEEDFMTLLSSNPNAGNNPSNQLSWSFSNLQPFQMSPYEFTMRLNTPTATVNPLNSNDILTFTGTVTGTGTDAMPADNVMVLDQTVVNSYDPNDKTCLEGKVIEPSLVGEYVHYMIRFENTGTASAVNIVVKDEIDLSQFDITTLIPLEGSHDYYTRVRDNNVVEFIHENINLDFNDATNDGYVLFKIKTLNTLIEGDTFDNTAEIYFDFNFPIITNTETVTVMSTASIGETTDTSIAVYPNPARDFINISSLNGLKSATLIDVNGRRLSQTNFIGNTTEQRISLENLTSGVYFVTIQSELGQKVEKVIVE
jgi:hypothetical protein